MMNYMKGLEGINFDQIITEMSQNGEYFTAYVMVALWEVPFGRDKFYAKSTSRNKFKALGHALEDIAKQVQNLQREEIV